MYKRELNEALIYTPEPRRTADNRGVETRTRSAIQWTARSACCAILLRYEVRELVISGGFTSSFPHGCLFQSPATLINRLTYAAAGRLVSHVLARAWVQRDFSPLPAIAAKARNTEVGINHLPLSLSIVPPRSPLTTRGLLGEHRLIARASDYPIIQGGLKAASERRPTGSFPDEKRLRPACVLNNIGLGV